MRTRASFFLCLLGALGAGPRSPHAAAQSRAVTAAEWDRAAAAGYLDARMAWWMTWPSADRDHETTCVSCHTSLPYLLARPSLRGPLGESGPTPPEAALLSDVVTRAGSWNEVEPYYPDQTVGLPKTSESRGTEAILNALVLAGRDARSGRMSDEARRAFDNMWRLQFTRGERAGAWAWLNFRLAPFESDGAEYFGAALAAAAVGMAPEDYADSAEIQERLTALRAYLMTGFEDRPPFDQLMLAWASAELSDLLTPEQSREVADRLAGLQGGDGGWSLSSLGEWTRQDGGPQSAASDGYATGLVTFVLLRAGASPSGEPLRGALDWLARNQDPVGGMWRAASLNKDRDPDSDRGLFMTDAATAFAVLALTEAERPGGR